MEIGAAEILALILQVGPPMIEALSKLVDSLIANPETPEEQRAHLAALREQLRAAGELVASVPLVPPGAGA